MNIHRLFSSVLGLALLNLTSGSGLAAEASTNTPAAQDVWISSLEVTRIEQGYGEGHANRSVDNRRLTVAGQVFQTGVGTHANSTIALELDGNALVLSGSAGVDDETDNRGSVVFKVQADGKEIWNSGLMKPKAVAKEFSLDVKGVKSLVLLATDGGDGNDYDHADWGNLKVTMTSGKPRLIVPPIEEAVVHTPKAAPMPRLTGAKVFGVRPGSPFLFTITATGDRPMTFAADDLPAGLQLDAQSGRITGKLEQAGEHVVTLHAKNAVGQAERKLKIFCGSQIGLTPAMGWNSWNCFAGSVTAEKIKSAADAMVNSGLINHGWTYINIDDYWQVHRNSQDKTLQGPTRAADGRILPNPRFPDMKGLTEYVHGKGLKIGIYSVPGPWTCGGCVGSFDHEFQDAQQYAEWGFDYLKYDWCSYNPTMEAYRGGNTNWNPAKAPNITYAGGSDLTKGKLPFKLMQEALAKQSRDILYSLCQYGMGNVWEWGTEVGGNSWRTTQDINDSWGSMANIGFNQAGHEKYAGPGHFNDPDMLVIGKLGWGRLRPTKLTPNEQYSHISLWCLLTSPLLIGCDMTQLDEFTLGLLTNDEVLDVNQDALGRQAARVAKNDQLEVWSKDLEDGAKAVGLFNRGSGEQTVTAKWSDLGLTGTQTVRDLWRQTDLGKFTGQFEIKVGRHGVVLVKLTPANR